MRGAEVLGEARSVMVKATVNPGERHFRKKSRHVKATGCWIWKDHVNRLGYGTTSICGKHWMAHRASYHHLVGPIPDGLTLDHLCRNTRCINPAHLEPVPLAVNMRRRYGSTQPLTHCVAGHLFDQENTYRHGRKRYCRKCGADGARRRRAQKNGAHP